MGKKPVKYDLDTKLAALDALSVSGNKSAVAKQFGITRATLYDWMEQEDQLRRDKYSNDAMLTLAERQEIDRNVLEGLDNYQQMLEQVGITEERKAKLGHKVEYILAIVVDLLEKHPDLSVVNPKDLAKIMIDLNAVKKDLYNEPTIIIEYRNQFMMGILQVLQDFLDADELREFVKKMEAVEADFEVL